MYSLSRHDPGLDHVALTSPFKLRILYAPVVCTSLAHLASESPQLSSFKLPRTRRWRTMGRTFRTMSTRTLMPGHSRIGNRIPRFPVFGGTRISRFPIEAIPDSRLAAGNRESGNGPFPDSAGNRSRIGVPGRHAGGFLVCAAAAAAANRRRRRAPHAGTRSYK
jgi:hypothetical protein